MHTSKIIWAVATATLLVGCGGAAPQKPMAPAAFRARVTAICAAANGEVEALPASLSNPVDVAGAAQLAASYEPIGQDLVRRLRLVVAPAADGNLYGQAVSETAQQLADLERVRSAANSGNMAAANQAVQAADAQNPDPLFTDLGLPVCAADPQPSSY